MVRALKLSPADVDEGWVRWRSGQAVKVLARQMRVNRARQAHQGGRSYAGNRHAERVPMPLIGRADDRALP